MNFFIILAALFTIVVASLMLWDRLPSENLVRRMLLLVVILLQLAIFASLIYKLTSGV